MKKFLKRLFKTILYIILIIIILIFLFLLIINNNKFNVYKNRDNGYNYIVTLNDKLEVYPKIKKFNKDDLSNLYGYDGYAIFHLNKFELEYEGGWDKLHKDPFYEQYNIETYPERNYLTISLKALRYSINTYKNMDFADKILSMFNYRSKIRYYQNGQTGSVSNFSVKNHLYEVLNGEQYEYYENGNIAFKSNYNNDILNGEQHTYFEDGSTFESGYFENGNGYNEFFSPEGKLLGTGEFIKNMIYSGLDIFFQTRCYGLTFIGRSPFDSFPEVLIQKKYKNGFLDGEYKEFYYCTEGDPGPFVNFSCMFGPLASSGYYKNGFAEGEFIKYYRDGSILEKCFYEKGIGNCTYYYPDGKILSEGQKRNGVKVDGYYYIDSHFGDWNYYGENGELLDIFEHTSCSSGKSKYTAY